MLDQLGNFSHGCFLSKVLLKNRSKPKEVVYYSGQRATNTHVLKLRQWFEVCKVKGSSGYQVQTQQLEENSHFTGCGLDCFLRGIFASLRPRSCSGCGGETSQTAGSGRSVRQPARQPANCMSLSSSSSPPSSSSSSNRQQQRRCHHYQTLAETENIHQHQHRITSTKYLFKLNKIYTKCISSCSII